MKATVKELWSEYMDEKGVGASEEKKALMHRLSVLGAEFIELIDGDQNKKFEEYCNVRSDLFSIEKYEAFEKGVIFGARFIFDIFD